MSLKDTHIFELTSRFDQVLHKYANLAAELAPKLVEFGKYKKELQILATEFQRRGVKYNEPETLVDLIENALKKQGEELIDDSKCNQDKGRTISE